LVTVAIVFVILSELGCNHRTQFQTQQTASKTIAQTELPFSQKLLDVLDDGLKTTGGSGVSAAVIVSGKGSWVGVSGMSDPKMAESIEPNMLFDIASVGKTFTSALAAR
jgi:CubicO group peptidase (beta-lactamase class C family)